jgi:Ca-activated chloride channel homolog
MKILFFWSGLLFYFVGYSQKKSILKQTRLLFVFDASNSMKAAFQNTTRMEGAKDLFYKFIDSLSKDKSIQFALRMYGHTVQYPPGDCNDSKLVVPFGANNLALIKQKVKEAKPTGITPIEHSLTEAANDFPDTKFNNLVILITDGIEECEGDPCKARQKLLEKGITFKPFIIGIGLNPEQIKTFECVGTYSDIEDVAVLSNISTFIQQQKLNKTTLQVNLLDTKSQPLESNVNITFYDAAKKEYKYNYIQTLNHKNNPDTFYNIDNTLSYKITAHTIPPQQSGEIIVTPGKHTIVAIDAPQGYLTITRADGIYNYNDKVKCVVRKKGEKTINVQPLNFTDKYITGSYEIEVLTLPRIIFPSALIEQSKTKSIQIPSAGMLQIKALEAGDGCILSKTTTGLKRVCNFSSQTQQSFYLQPGDYIAVWRSKSLRGSIYSIEKKFSIVADLQTLIEFYK